MRIPASITIKFRDLKNNQGFVKYSKNASWLFGEKILRIIVSFFVGIWVARYLGPEQFGLFSYSQSFVGLFAVIATFGLDSIVIRELVKSEARRDELIGTAFWLKLLGTFVVLGILAITVNLTSSDSYTNTLVFIIASATIFQSFNVVDFYFQAKVMSKYVVYANALPLFLGSLIKIVLILNEAPLEYFAISMVFDGFVLACGFVYFYIKHAPHLNIKNLTFKWEVAKHLLKDSWPLAFSGAVVAIYMRIDQVMIKEMMDLSSVGQYAVASKLSEAWYFIPMIIGTSLLPSIINSKKNNEKLYYKRLQNFYTLMVWLAIIIALLISFFSYDIVDILYGQDFHRASKVLVIQAWVGVFASLGMACRNWYIAENYITEALYKAIFGMVINIIGNYYLIQLYGIEGAAISSILGQISANIIYDFLDKKVRGQIKYKIRAFLPIYLIKKEEGQ
jgi:O-antigen/teichoic acid export membrane protein